MTLTDKQLHNILAIAVKLTDAKTFEVPLNYKLLFYANAGVSVWTLIFREKKAEAQFKEFYGIWPYDSLLAFPEAATAPQRRAQVLSGILSLLEGQGAFTTRYEQVRL